MKTYELATTNGHLLQVRAETYVKHSDLLVFYDALGEVDRFPASYIMRVNEHAVHAKRPFAADHGDRTRREAI